MRGSVSESKLKIQNSNSQKFYKQKIITPAREFRGGSPEVEKMLSCVLVEDAFVLPCCRCFLLFRRRCFLISLA